MSRRRQRNKSKNGSAGTSLEQLEQNFVLGCGTSSEQRLLSNDTKRKSTIDRHNHEQINAFRRRAFERNCQIQTNGD